MIEEPRKHKVYTKMQASTYGNLKVIFKWFVEN
jgi:hypothetical protein